MFVSKASLLALASLAGMTNASSLRRKLVVSEPVCTTDAELINVGDAEDFVSDPIDVISQDGESVTFTVSQTWSDDRLCLITTHFTPTTHDFRICPISSNVGPGKFAEFTAKCEDDGFAYVDVYVFDPTFEPASNPPIPAICEQTPQTHTYEYKYKIPCTSGGDSCEPSDKVCKDFAKVSYDFESAEQVAEFSFGKGVGALTLDAETVETYKMFEVPTNASSLSLQFDLTVPETLPADQKLFVRAGPYYLDLTSVLGLEIGKTNSAYYGEAYFVAIKTGPTSFMVVGTIPPVLYKETGKIDLGVRSTGSGGAVLSVDNLKLGVSCGDVVTGPKAGGGGGDPHFQRWGREHTSFHGECDLVMVSSKDFHDGAGLDLHVRTTIESYFSYIETAALRVGDYVMEFHKDMFYIDGVEYKAKESLPLTFGGDFKYTVTNPGVEAGKNPRFYQYYKVDLHQGSTITFRFYKQYLTIAIEGHPEDFADSVGLLGDYETGAMVSRDGQIMTDYTAYGFEWQVNPEDVKILRGDRAPQLPFEQCRMPTAARPARRLRGADLVLYEQAEAACSHVKGTDFALCVDDVMATGDLGLTTLW